MMAPGVVVGLVLLLVAGCSTVAPSPAPTPSPTPTPSYPVVEGYDLPRIDGFYETNPICAGVGMEPLTLHGELVDGEAVVVAVSLGEIPTLWPRGYKARFEPNLVILDKMGTPVAKEGSDLNVGWPGVFVCPMGHGGSPVVYVMPEATRAP